jgi:hypothetical protein
MAYNRRLGNLIIGLLVFWLGPKKAAACVCTTVWRVVVRKFKVMGCKCCWMGPSRFFWVFINSVRKAADNKLKKFKIFFDVEASKLMQDDFSECEDQARRH